MGKLQEYLIRANVSGLTLCAGGVIAMLSRDGTVPYFLVISLLAFLMGIVTWGIGKTPIRLWGYWPGNQDGCGGFIGNGREPMKIILPSLELLSLYLGAGAGIVFLIGVAR